MIRLPRPSLPTLAVGAPIIGGIATGAVAVTSALAQDWSGTAMALLATAWAALAAVWAHRATTHACPPPPAPVERGLQCLHFIGGPRDGGQALLYSTRDVHGTTLTIEGTDYTLGEVEGTCYRAELAPATAASEGGGDR